MTTITPNVKTLNANELLADYTKGIGATANIAELQEPSPDTVKGFELSQAQLVAFTRLYVKDRKIDFIAAMSKGYLGVLHESQYNEGAKKTDNDTLVTTKANISSEQYLANCVKLGLTSPAIIEDAIDLALFMLTDLDKVTKANIILAVKSFTSKLVTEEQHAVYTVKSSDELEAAKKFEALTAAGFTAVRKVIDGRYSAELALANWVSMPILEESYELVSPPIKLPSGNYQLSFKDKIIAE